MAVTSRRRRVGVPGAAARGERAGGVEAGSRARVPRATWPTTSAVRGRGDAVRHPRGRWPATLSWSPGALSGSICSDTASDLNDLQHFLSTGVGVFSIDRSPPRQGLEPPVLRQACDRSRSIRPRTECSRDSRTRGGYAKLDQRGCASTVRLADARADRPPIIPARRRRLRRRVVAARR
jgi:hypothetical protein